MKALNFHPPGGPEKLLFETTPVPTPDPSQILIAVHAVPIITYELTWPMYQNPDGSYITHIPGHDFSGVVVSTGSEVKNPDLQPGKPVVAFTTRRNVEGAMAEFALADQDQVVRKPRNLGFEDAASVPLCALTAWQALYGRAELRAGQKVLVTGAAGGMGLWVVQVAKYIGAYVVGTATREESARVLRENRVDEVINVRNDSLANHAKEFDLVVDCVGGQVFGEMLRTVKEGGLAISFVVYGAEAEGREKGVKSLFFIVTMDKEQLEEIHKLVEEGKLRPVVDAVFPFEEVQAAWAKCLEGHNRGKVVLQIKKD